MTCKQFAFLIRGSGYVPNSERRQVSVHSHRILQLYKKWLSNSAPYMLLRPKKMWQRLAAADAFGAGDTCGIGGIIRSPTGVTHWFSERFNRHHYVDLEIDLETDLQKSITSMETLAQIAILRPTPASLLSASSS